MAFYACGLRGPETIKIGINAPLSGDMAKVDEGTKFAAEMWLEDINAAGGIQVGDKQYKVELVNSVFASSSKEEMRFCGRRYLI